jgi:predicted ArsR family transcriptional regulator
MNEHRRDSVPLQPRDDPRLGDDLAGLAILDEPNRRRLYELVARVHMDVGRDHAADALGISRELAAFHLDRLVEAGLLRASYRRLTGRTGPGAGRPAKVYSRAERDIAVTLPPRRYDSLAELFAEGLQRLADEGKEASPTDAVASAGHERGREAGAAVRRAAGRRPTHRRVIDALRSLLTEQGYEPELAGNGRITLCNCPYRAVAEQHRDLTCGANRAWAEGVVEELRDPRIVAVFDPEPGRCCVRFAES